MERLLDRIDSKLDVPETLTVVAVPDEAWRQWVLEFIRRADAVLVDVTHLSENLRWELRTCAELLKPGQLLLAYSGQEVNETRMPPAVRSELRCLLGDDILEQSQWFVYRAPRRRWWRKTTIGEFELIGARRHSGPLLLEAMKEAFSARDVPCGR